MLQDFTGNWNNVTLIDDGTLDTVLACNGMWIRYSSYARDHYVDDDGEFDVDAFIDAHAEDFDE